VQAREAQYLKHAYYQCWAILRGRLPFFLPDSLLIQHSLFTHRHHVCTFQCSSSRKGLSCSVVHFNFGGHRAADHPVTPAVKCQSRCGFHFHTFRASVVVDDAVCSHICVQELRDISIRAATGGRCTPFRYSQYVFVAILVIMRDSDHLLFAHHPYIFLWRCF
jgi:hypothetical protein